jgi:hypothetical protein
LNDWLQRVIQAVKPFYSPEIEKGAKWSSEIDDALEGTRFGIVCLTPDNLHSTWIHFETGALSKTKDALIWTFLHGLNPGDVPPPLGKFQHTVAEKGDVLRLLKTINSRLGEVGGEPLQDRLLEENFELFWPRLEESLKAAEQLINSMDIGKTSSEVETLRNERAILNEILELVRSQERRLNSFEDRFSDLSGHVAPNQRRKRRTKWYNEIRIPISSQEANANGIAAKFSDFFSQHATGVAVIIEDGETERLVRVTFANPIDYEAVNTLVDRAKSEVDYEPPYWIGTLTDGSIL